LQANVFGALAVKWADASHQNEIQTFVGCGALHRRLVSRAFDYAEATTVSRRVCTGEANGLGGEGVARLAVLNFCHRSLQSIGNQLGTFTVMLQQVVSHA
jgi:hypothetical protein